MTKYKNIQLGFLIIALDNNGINRDRSVDQQEEEATKFLESVSAEFDLQTIDTWIGKLSEEEFDDVMIGEESESLSITETAPDGTKELLNRYFDEVC